MKEGAQVNFHIDIAEVQTAEGRLYLLVAIDCTSKFAFVELHQKATRRAAADFLRHLIQTVAYKVHTALIDNGTHFTNPAGRRLDSGGDQGNAGRRCPIPPPCF